MRIVFAHPSMLLFFGILFICVLVSGFLPFKFGSSIREFPENFAVSHQLSWSLGRSIERSDVFINGFSYKC